MDISIRLSLLIPEEPSTQIKMENAIKSDTPIPMEPATSMVLLGCGFNAHGQLNGRDTADEVDDRKSFTRLAVSSNIRVIFAGWSTTVAILGTGVQVAGHVERVPSYAATEPLYLELGPETSEILSAYGTSGGPIGFTSKCKHIWYVYNHSLSLMPFP
jgi:hypothetical protein